MKTPSLLRCKSLSLIGMMTLATAGLHAQTTTWLHPTNNGVWSDAGNWSDGVPDDTVSAIMNFALTSAKLQDIPAGTSILDLNVTKSGTTGLSLGFSGPSPTSLRNFNLHTSEGTTNIYVYGGPTHNSDVRLTGALNLTASNGGISNYELRQGSTFTAAGGIHLSGTETSFSEITYGGLGAGTVTFNADVTFNRGSRMRAVNVGSANATVQFNGNVTLTGLGTGANAANFIVGRGGATPAQGNGFKVVVRDHLQANGGAVSIIKGKELHVSTATIATGASLGMSGYTDSEGDGLFRSTGNLDIAGGTLALNNSAGADGFRFEVGGDFILRTGSSVNLNASATGITTLALEGDLDLRATALANGNLNQLRVQLAGDELQSLEVAVTDSTKTFATHTLRLNSSKAILVDDFLNLGAGEYFQTAQLFNDGTSTLFLNDHRFFVGANELLVGDYTHFGGLLQVRAIPEPSTMLLLGGAVILLGLNRRRKL